MAKKLTVHNAEIQTAAVEIKTLTVSGKQVTLAVFRQLREEPLIAEDGTLNGQPWGTVNYHPDKCGDLDEHWHVVWQKGEDLLRDRVFRQAAFGTYRSELADRYLLACVWEHVNGGTRHLDNVPLPSDGDVPTRPNFKSDQLFKLDGVHVRARTTKAAVEAVEAHARLMHTRRQRVPNQMMLEIQEGHLAEAVQVLDGDFEAIGRPTADDAYAALRQELSKEAARRRRHEDLRDEIAQLPQLFIAV